MVHAPAQVPGVCGGDPLCDREGRAHQRGRERGGRRSVQRQITECFVYHAGAEGGASDSASRAHGDADHGKSILVRAGVEATVGAAIDMSIVGHTQRRYASAWKRYLGWCRSQEEEPLPVTEDKAFSSCTSPHVRWAFSSNSPLSGANASPALRQPKKHMQVAAHNIFTLSPFPLHTECMALMWTHFTGSLTRVTLPSTASIRAKPFLNWANLSMVLQSGALMPALI